MNEQGKKKLAVGFPDSPDLAEGRAEMTVVEVQETALAQQVTSKMGRFLRGVVGMKTAADLEAEEKERELKELKRKCLESINSKYRTDKGCVERRTAEYKRKRRCEMIYNWEKNFADDLELWRYFVQWPDYIRHENTLLEIELISRIRNVPLSITRTIYLDLFKKYSPAEPKFSDYSPKRSLYGSLVEIAWNKLRNPEIRDYLLRRLLEIDKSSLGYEIRQIVGNSDKVVNLLISESKVDDLIEYCKNSELLSRIEWKRKLQQLEEYLARDTAQAYR